MVDSCKECPYRHGDICIHGAHRIEIPEGIPNWCPLDEI